MCFVHDKDRTTWPAMMKTAVHISWPMLPTMSALRGWPNAVGEEPRRVPSSHVSGCLLCISGSPKRYYGAPRTSLPRLAVSSGGES